MRYDPHMLIEGIIIACWAMQAHTSYIYIRGEFSEPQRKMEAAIEEAYAKGILGSRVLESGFPSRRVRPRGRRRLCVRRGNGAHQQH